MMDIQLTTWLLFNNAATHHRDCEVVSRLPSGEVHRYTLGDFSARAKQLMNALDCLGLARGAVVATLAWNGYRHLEAYFAVPCSGRVLHTLNVRLSEDELAFVMNDAADEVVLVDPDFLPLLERVLGRVPSVRHVIVLDPAAGEGSVAGALSYEELIASQPARYSQPELDERSPAGLCHTSGTTGRSKGVVSTHRSVFLHALAVSSGAGMSIGPSDCVLPQVPMFHASAWGLPYTCVAVGAKLVLYGGALQPESFISLLSAERVSVAAAVPTVWISVAEEMKRQGVPATPLRHIFCGGSQPPRSLIERYQREFGIPVIQGWGMTETSPLAAAAWPQERMRDLDDEQLMTAVRRQAGLPLPGIEVCIRDDDGHPLPFDGASMGALHVRGPWVTDGYLNGVGAGNFTADGWFNTGDVAIGSPDGYFTIADRTKDLIKSGGEWISSIDMEAAIMGLPQVTEAAVIAIPDDTWGERPLACVVLETGAGLDIDALRDHLEESGFARWQLPDHLAVVDAIPQTSVGKFDKKLLRARFAEGQ